MMDCVNFKNDFTIITGPANVQVYCAEVQFYNQSDGPVYINGLKLLPFSSYSPPAAVCGSERDTSTYQIVFDALVTQPALVVVKKNRS